MTLETESSKSDKELEKAHPVLLLFTASSIMEAIGMWGRAHQSRSQLAF